MFCDSLAESWICLLEPVGTHIVYQVLAAYGFNLTPLKTAFILLMNAKEFKSHYSTHYQRNNTT